MTRNLVVVALLAALVWIGVGWRPFATDSLSPETAIGAGDPAPALERLELETRPTAEPDRSLAGVETGAQAGLESESAAGEPGLATPSGSVVIRATWPGGAPAAGITIDLRVSGRGLPSRGVARVVSDARGEARATGLPVITLVVSCDRGRGEDGVTVDVVAGAETEVDFEVPAGVLVEGVVTTEAGHGVAGAGIWVTTGAKTWQGGSVLTHADARGRFSLRDVPAGQSIGAQAAGYAPSELIDLDDLDTSVEPVRVELRLETPGGGARGVVLDPAGAPVPGAWVSVGALPGDMPYRMATGGFREAWTPRAARTDAEGRFDFEGLAPGEHPVSAFARPFPIWSGTITLVPEEKAEIEIRLTEGFTLEGTVRDAAGDAFPGAVLRAFPRPIDMSFVQFGQFDYESTFGYPFVVADARGHYRLSGLPAGEAHVFASPPPTPERMRREAQMRAENVVRGADGDVLDWDPVIAEGPTIAGIVTFKDGSPMKRVFVSARDETTGKAQSITTNEEGRFRFLNLERSPHTLGVQFWSPPKDAQPLETSGVLPDGDEVRLVASFENPDMGEPGTIVGRVEDAAGRIVAPVETVVILRYEGNAFQPQEAQDDGSFRYEGVKPGRYKLIVRAGEVPVHDIDWFELAPGQTLDVGTLVTQPGGAIALSLQREERTRAVDVVAWLAGKSRGSRQLKIGTAEQVVVDNVSAGEYTIAAYGDGMAIAEGTITVTAGQTTEASLELTAAVHQRIEVFWPEARTLGHLRLHVEDDTGKEHWDSKEPNAAFLERPYVRVLRLPLGRYVATAETHSGMKGSAAFEIADLDATPEVVRVEMR